MLPLRSTITLFVASILFSGYSQESKWDLKWSDEFDYTGSPDTEFWGYETGFVRNREMQYYTDHLQNARVENGRCIIKAQLEQGDSITSACIITHGKINFLYGRLEVRAKIPSALGSWPAIWMLGSNYGDIEWPECGEIDIMEHGGFNPRKIHANIHTKAYNHELKNGKGDKIKVRDPSADFHIYALEWSEDRMDFFFDNKRYFRYKNDKKGDPATWPFNMPHYLLINLAFGGAWGGSHGVDTSLLPLQFEIDYVRYYKERE